MAEQQLDPKTLEDKYKYQSDADDAAIAKVENAIKQRFGDGGASYSKGLEDSPVKQEEFDAKKKEYSEKIEQAKKDQPEDAKKEGTPPPLMSGPAANPAIQKPNVPPSNETPKKQEGKGGGHEEHKGGEKPQESKAPAPMPAPPNELVLKAAATGDGNLDKFLDDYPNKSPETTGQMSKIKQMGDVARGFDGQVEGYISTSGSALEPIKGAAVNFLGKKELSAIFSHNPYEKVEGGLGRIMRGLSTFQNVVSIVGNVTGKLGMILSVVGLLGMIFPPLGAAIEAIARVLNLVGLVCDGIGFALSMVLTSLNGVVLAQQIAKGGSNEEKAAAADMMVSEATSASGHVMNLALNYGPKFMKGFKGASKGVLGSLMKRFKTVVTKWGTKALGPVGNWAKKAAYSMGYGLEKAEPSAAMAFAKKAWHAPGALLEKARNSDFVKHVNASSFSKKAEKLAAGLNNNSFLKDDLAEKAAQGIGNAGQTKFKGFADRMHAAADADERAAAHAAAESAATNAGNRERAKIERDIAKNRDIGDSEYKKSIAGGQGVSDEEAAVRSREAYADADKAEVREKADVKKAEKEGRREKQKEQREAADEKRADEYKEAQEERNKDKFNEDPVAFRKETGQIEHRYNELRHKLKNPTLKNDVREKLEHDAERMKQGLDQRKMVGYEASGGEPIETMWDARKQLKEGWEHAHLKDEHAEWVEAGTKEVEKKTGHDNNEAFEHHERAEKIEEFGEEPVAHTADQVDAMLVGLDDDEAHDEPAADGGGDADPDDSKAAHDEDMPQAPVARSTPTPAPAPDEGGVSVAPAVVVAAAPAAAPPEKKEEAPETPELAYWPKLVGNDGEFKKATGELYRMKMVAYGFRKAQLDARKQAIDVAANMGKYAEVTARYQQNATKQGGSLQNTIHEATQAGSAADQGSNNASAGAKKQQDGEANGGGKEQPVPDVGEIPSRWHPFKRILWHMKKWAADKAASVFGWIQGKITNFILKAVCGVSMDDMRNYTTALHHRMEFSKVAGTQGTEAAKRAVVSASDTKAKSDDYGVQALEDAKECDQNINDADGFVRDIENTEQDLAAEQSRAAIFLAGLAAAVAAEKQRREEEKQKKAAEAANNAAGAGAPSAAPAAAAAPAGTLAAAFAAPRKKLKPAVSPAAAVKLKAAAGYVLSQIDVLSSQLASTRDQRADRLKTRVGTLPLIQQLSFAKLDGTGKGTLEAFRLHAGEAVIAMHNVQNDTPADRQRVKSLAAEVRQHARALDDASGTAHQSLNFAFKAAYEQVSKVA